MHLSRSNLLKKGDKLIALKIFLFKRSRRTMGSLKKSKEFSILQGVGGFEKVIFHKNKKKNGLKMPKIAFFGLFQWEK